MARANYRTRRLEALHKTGAALHRVGALDKAPMRDLDAICLTPVGTISADDIQKNLCATSAAGSPDANGQARFPFSWYTQLVPVALSPAAWRVLRTDFKRAILPRFLTGTAILELQAIPSNA